MLYFVSGVIIVVLCFTGILFKKDKVRQGLFIAILIAIAIPFILSDFTAKQNSVKYFKCTRCGEICTATENEYKYDASHQKYYIEHDCPRYVPHGTLQGVLEVYPRPSAAGGLLYSDGSLPGGGHVLILCLMAQP